MDAVVKFCALALLALSCAGCVAGREDWQKPAKLCQVWIVLQPDNTAVCVSRDEWNRYWKPVLIPQQDL